jgi:flagellar biosynthesis/type III secretory pathway protein FliH
MPLHVARRYVSPPGMSLRWQGPVLSADVWPALSQGSEILAVARKLAEDVTKRAEFQAIEILDSAHIQAQLTATQDSLAAQRDVWKGVLEAWLGFVERVYAQRCEAVDFALQAVKVVVKHLKLDTSVEQQMVSSVSLLLEQSVQTAAGELRVCPEDAPAVHVVLSRLGRSDLLIVADAAISSGACVLRCGELSFETRFDNNVQVMLDALELISCGATK